MEIDKGSERTIPSCLTINSMVSLSLPMSEDSIAGDEEDEEETCCCRCCCCCCLVGRCCILLGSDGAARRRIDVAAESAFACDCADGAGCWRLLLSAIGTFRREEDGASTGAAERAVSKLHLQTMAMLASASSSPSDDRSRGAASSSLVPVPKPTPPPPPDAKKAPSAEKAAP